MLSIQIVYTFFSYESIFHRLARSFNLSFRYKDDVLSLNNPSFWDLIHRIFPKELVIKDTTDAVKSASYLELHLEIVSKRKLLTKIYDKRDDFSIEIVNFPLICVLSFRITTHTLCQSLSKLRRLFVSR